MTERPIHLVRKEQTCGAEQRPSLQEPEPWYASLPLDTVHALEQRIQRINAVVAQAALDVGRELVEAHKEIQGMKEGSFQAWVKARIGISEQEACQLMAVSERFGERNLMVLSRFAQTALLLLSAPSVLQEAYNQALAQAASAEAIRLRQ
jgi:16S rRNA C1402 (ribose-2'-O) methylase RsmI